MPVGYLPAGAQAKLWDVKRIGTLFKALIHHSSYEPATAFPAVPPVYFSSQKYTYCEAFTSADLQAEAYLSQTHSHNSI